MTYDKGKDDVHKRPEKNSTKHIRETMINQVKKKKEENRAFLKCIALTQCKQYKKKKTTIILQGQLLNERHQSSAQIQLQNIK